MENPQGILPSPRASKTDQPVRSCWWNLIFPCTGATQKSHILCLGHCWSMVAFAWKHLTLQPRNSIQRAGVGKKNMGCSKPRALKGQSIMLKFTFGNDVVRCQFFRNCVQEMSRSFLSIMPVWVVDLEFRSFYQGVILQMKGREDDRSIIYRSIKGCRPKVETPIWSLQITCP